MNLSNSTTHTNRTWFDTSPLINIQMHNDGLPDVSRNTIIQNAGLNEIRRKLPLEHLVKFMLRNY